MSISRLKRRSTWRENLTDDRNARGLTRLQRKIVEASAAISESEIRPSEVDFVHASFAQIALPRRKVLADTFERKFGAAHIHIAAGVLAGDNGFEKQAMPYGLRPRQFLIYVTTYAIKNKTTEIPLGGSLRDLMLNHLGYKSVSGGVRGIQTSLRAQLRALVASRITLGWHERGRNITRKLDIFTRLEDPREWYRDGAQRNLWPAVAHLSEDYLENLREHSFPVDPRAIHSLESALAVDLYCWLAYRLCRLDLPLELTWTNLRNQFGQDYASSKDFKTTFLLALNEALAVYKDAKVEPVYGGLKLHPSPPPVRKTSVQMLGLRESLD